MMSAWFGKNLQPSRIQIECNLYHGADPIVEPQYTGENVYFSNSIRFNEYIKFVVPTQNTTRGANQW